jgi:hypothetical protein
MYLFFFLCTLYAEQVVGASSVSVDATPVRAAQLAKEAFRQRAPAVAPSPTPQAPKRVAIALMAIDYNMFESVFLVCSVSFPIPPFG